MSESNTVKRVASVSEPRAAESEAIYLPAVDIRENGNHVRLTANLPGVAPEDAEVTVENDVLTIAGRVRTELPPGHELVGQEFGGGRFRRAFELSDAVQADGVKARLRNGVLEVTLPKREEVKTRKIKIVN